jgi:hypothetical protein
MTITAESMAVGRQVWCWSSSWELVYWKNNHEAERNPMEWHGLFEAHFSDTPFPTRPHLLILPKQFYQQKHSNTWAPGEHFHSNHHIKQVLYYGLFPVSWSRSSDLSASTYQVLVSQAFTTILGFSILFWLVFSHRGAFWILLYMWVQACTCVSQRTTLRIQFPLSTFTRVPGLSFF